MSILPTTNTDWVELFDGSSAPMYVVDDNRRIVYCNPACCRWLGVSAAELIGQRCTYHTSPAAQGAPAAALCPPPKSFCGQVVEAVLAWPAAGGEVKYRRARFWPLDDGSDESAPVLAMLDRQDCPRPELADRTDVALHDRQLHEQLQRLRHQLAGRYTVDSLLGVSPAIVRVRARAQLAAEAETHVLIIGPAGVGKDHVAKAIHYGQASPGALVPLSCALLETNLLRSTLRALSQRLPPGESSATLLLEDVDVLAAEAQADLLELIASGPRHLRVIGTSTRPLAQLAAGEAFSRELLCAISTIAIEIPPLAERLEDLPLLAQAFLEEYNASSIKQLGGFSTAVLDRLSAYHWPGNLDELAAVVREICERAVAGEAATVDLPSRLLQAASAAAQAQRATKAIVLDEFLAQVEHELVTRALRRAKGNKSKAARLLGLTRPKLYRRLVQLGIEKPSQEPPGE